MKLYGAKVINWSFFKAESMFESHTVFLSCKRKSHKKVLSTFFIAVFLLIQCSGWAQSSIIEDEINQITDTSYRSHFDSLHTSEGCSRKVVPRKTQQPCHNACRDYIFRTLSIYLSPEQVYLHPFSERNIKGLANVIGCKKGTSDSGKMIIIGAHYDSNSNDEINGAPGANDNATGVAAMLECARIISKLNIEENVIFAAWDMEEQFTNGMPSGSNQWFTDHFKKINRKRKMNPSDSLKINPNMILFYINFDMIGNPSLLHEERPVIWLYSGVSKHQPFIDEVEKIVSQVSSNVSFKNNRSLMLSDHYTFARNGIPSVLFLESRFFDDPFYHTPQDSNQNPQNIKYEIAAQVARAGLTFILSKTTTTKPSDN